MGIQMFNGWYFFALIICIGLFLLLFFILRKKSQKTQKIVLFFILLIGLILHFLKVFIPPYSTDEGRLLRDSWFINICGANIFLYPFFFLSKSKSAKDYMFYLGIFGGLFALLYPMEPMAKVNQSAEWLDIARFYYHHLSLFAVPMLMVLFKLHTLSYKRVFATPTYLLVIMLFIMINQVLQSELGFINLRGDDIFNINYKNSSMIWGPSGAIGDFLAIFCPSFFKTIPVGAYAGEAKFWPWFWLIFPAYILLTPAAFLICLIFDYKNFIIDMKNLNTKIKTSIAQKKSNKSQTEDKQMSIIRKVLKDK